MKKSQSIDDHLLKIIDSLIFQSKKQDAWISALTEKIVFFEAASTGKPVKELKRELSRRQKYYLQKLMEKIEDKNPELAAKLDQRSERDMG
jgi:replication-associated recombination protein RarA